MKNTTDWSAEERAARIAELTGELEHLTANPPPNPRTLVAKRNALARLTEAGNIAICIELVDGHHCGAPRYKRARCRACYTALMHFRYEGAKGRLTQARRDRRNARARINQQAHRDRQALANPKPPRIPKAAKVKATRQPGQAKSKAPRRITIERRPCMNEPSIPKPVEMFPTPTSDQLAQVQRIPAHWELRQTDWSDFDERKRRILENRA